MGRRNFWRRTRTVYSRDFCPSLAGSPHTKFGGLGAPNFGAFDGKVEILTLNISGAEYFSGPKFTSGRGPPHPLPTCQNWSCCGVHFGPQKFLTQKLFFDCGPRDRGVLKKYSSDFRFLNDFRHRLDRFSEFSSLLPLWAFCFEIQPPKVGQFWG